MTTILRINRGDVHADKQTGVTESLVSKGFTQLIGIIYNRVTWFTLLYFTILLNLLDYIKKMS